VTPDEGRRYPLYVPPTSRTWWLRSGPYRRFAAREITSMFAAIFSGLMIAFLFALSSGQGAYQDFLRLLDTPGMTAALAVVLVALVYHSATWFRLTTHIVVIRLGRWKVTRSALLTALVAAWIGVSVAVAYFHVWF